MNKQQELLYNVLSQKSSEMLAAISRVKDDDDSIMYGIVFFRKKGDKIIPEIGVRTYLARTFSEEVETFETFPSLFDFLFETEPKTEIKPQMTEIVGKEMLKDLSIEKCVQNYRHFVWYDSRSWTDSLFEIQDIAEVILREFLAGESVAVLNEDLTYLGERIQDVIPHFCAHIHRDGDFSYEW